MPVSNGSDDLGLDAMIDDGEYNNDVFNILWLKEFFLLLTVYLL